MLSQKKAIMKYTFFIIALMLFGFFACDYDASSTLEVGDDLKPEYDNLELQDGFKAAIVSEEVGRARHIAVRENGDIFVQLRKKNKGGGIAALRDTNGDSKADLIRYFGDTEGTGICIKDRYLYASSDEAVYRYPLNKDFTPNEDQRVLIAGGFPTQNQHASKSFALDDTGNIYVNVGSPSNACMEQARTQGSPGIDPCPQREWQASIWRFDANGVAQQQQRDGYKYAEGIRNSVAVTWNPNTNSLFVMQHGRDQLHDMFPNMYTQEESAELPSEELLAVSDGDDFGWPYCYFDHLQDKKLLAPEYGGDGSKQGRCENVAQPVQTFPGHMAPNDLLFYTGDQFPERYKNGAFIAFHGSWNRSPFEQKGYFIVFVPMDGKRVIGDWEVFAAGFAGAGEIKSPSDAIARPTGLAQGPDGALYVTDSVKGKIWKIVYEG